MIRGIRQVDSCLIHTEVLNQCISDCMLAISFNILLLLHRTTNKRLLITTWRMFVDQYRLLPLLSTVSYLIKQQVTNNPVCLAVGGGHSPRNMFFMSPCT